MVAKREEGGGRMRLADANLRVCIYRIDKQQDPTVEHRELYSAPCDKP